MGLCSRVVLELMEGLEDHGFELYTDNYYTSPKLFLTLYKIGYKLLWNSKNKQERLSLISIYLLPDYQ